jgi:hypothetical protein
MRCIADGSEQLQRALVALFGAWQEAAAAASQPGASPAAAHGNERDDGGAPC